MALSPLEGLTDGLKRTVSAQKELTWTPPAMARSLDALVEVVEQIGAVVWLTASASASAGASGGSSAGVATDALSLGVGVSASAAASLSLGLSLGIGISATAGIDLAFAASIAKALTLSRDLDAALVSFNTSASAAANSEGRIVPGTEPDASAVTTATSTLSRQLGDAKVKAEAAAPAKPIEPITAQIRMPRMGAWHADISTSDEETLSGLTTFTVDGVTYVGTVKPSNSGLDGTRARCRVVGGRGGLSTKVQAKSYSGGAGTRVGTIVADILKDCGESLSDLSDAELLERRVPRWHITEGLASHALVKLADAVGGAWRVLRDGTLWFGVETWPEVSPEGLIVDEDWSEGAITFAAEAPNMIPGTVFQGQRIELVVHELGETLRTTARISSPSSAMNRFLAPLRQEIDYSRLWPSRVVAQNDDGTVSILPDDEKIKAKGLDKVRVRHGVPGLRVRFKQGARLALGFLGGDPSRPYAALPEDETAEQANSHIDSIEFQAGGRSAPLARVGDPVQVFVTTGVPIPVSGTITPPGAAFVGFMTITTPLFATIQGGNAKLTG